MITITHTIKCDHPSCTVERKVEYRYLQGTEAPKPCPPDNWTQVRGGMIFCPDHPVTVTSTTIRGKKRKGRKHEFQL